MAERRVKPSHPDFKALSEYAHNITTAKNTQLFFNMQDVDTSTPEFQAWLKENISAMHELLEGGSFRDEFPDLF